MTQEVNNPASGKITLPSLSMNQPNPGEGYMIIARDLLQGVETLSTLHSISPRACAMIAAHTLECMLKAFLWHRGKRTKIRESKVQHNITTLWDISYKEKILDIPEDPPDWVKILSWGHGPNFYFRYQEGKKDQSGKKTVVHGGQTPALIPMAMELSKLIAMVENVIKGC